MCAKEADLDKKSYFESERMNRRTALKRLGIATGMTAFSLLTVDDLARIASKKLMDIHLCEELANEFKDVGGAAAQASGEGCVRQCDDSFDICDLRCDQTWNPLHFNCGNGNFNPACTAYQACLDYSCKPAKDRCYQCCAVEGENCYDA
jgi:hypothetical protein